MSTNYLHSLKTNDLLRILRHVQLGKEHLLKKLTQSEFDELLAIGGLSNNQINKIETDKQEKIGNVSIVMNTILTSCFGAWLGFTAFSENELISVMTIFIIIAAISIGPLTGYLSFLLTHRQAQLAIESQQLCNVERIIIEIIIHKRELAISHLSKKIHHLLLKVSGQSGVTVLNSHHYSVTQLFDLVRKAKFQACKVKLSPMEKKIFSRIQKNFSHLDNGVKEKKEQTAAETSYDETDFMLNNSLTNASYIKILAKSDLSTKQQIPQVNKWLKKNALGICVGLLPTLLGSFASMFVFLNGVPAFFNALNLTLHLSSWQVLALKKSALCCATCVSLYFAFSHIHSNYKSFKRAKQLEISSNIIAEKNNKMLQLMTQFNVWTKIYYNLRLLSELHENKMIPLSSTLTG